jgi:4-amino-4-deoxy-L-arabinose transferase-like glycosyltransferase
MTSLADRLRTSTIPARIVAAWNAASTRRNPIAVIVVVWALLSVPLVFFRGYNSDEGLAVSIARTALEDGDWLTPHMFNLRWIERPTLLSWIIAALSAPFGSVSQVTARLPLILFLLLGCLLIYALLRKAAASVPAALFGVAVFLACPLVMRAYVMITADMPLAVLLFLAFVLWWHGYAKGSIGLGRWSAIGLVLALAGLMKGPQPISYFALGVGFFVLLSRSWRQIPGLVLAGLICAVPLAAWYWHVYAAGDEASWAAFMRLRPVALLPGPLPASLRLLTETLPAALAAAAFLISPWLGGEKPEPAGIRRRAHLLRLRGVARHSVLAGRQRAALLLPDGAAARRARRPRL